MNSTSPVHETRELARAAWRAALLLAATSIASGIAVAFGLWAAFGPSPERRVLPADLPSLYASPR